MIRLLRFWAIIRAILLYRLYDLVDIDALPPKIRWPLQLLRRIPSHKGSRGERIRLALESLGPIFVKFGQLLSTRPDLLPADIAKELDQLQDRVAPFASDQAIAIVEQALEASVDELFADFSVEPLASASVAQVHAARLKDGSEVVVKVVRPGIEKTIRQDLHLMYGLAQFVQRWFADGRRLKPVEVVQEYEHTIIDELDLQREAANAAHLRRNFVDSDLLYVPEVYWDYTNRQVMVSERINGIPVSDIDALQAQNTNLEKLAVRGVEIFFTQVFKHNFFHADMHPGNIFVSKHTPYNPQYIAIDCAIIGTLSEADQYYLARNLLAIFRQNYRQVAELHIECGWVPKDTAVGDFEGAIRSVCEPIFEKPLNEISFGKVLFDLFRTARRFEMEVQPSLVLLQKTLLNIEGLGRQLYPELDLWATAQPFLEEWVKERYSPKTLFQQTWQRAPEWAEQMPHIPHLALTALQNLAERESHVMAEPNNQAAPSQASGIGPWLGATCLLASGWGLAQQAALQPLDWQSPYWLLGAAGLYLVIQRR